MRTHTACRKRRVNLWLQAPRWLFVAPLEEAESMTDDPRELNHDRQSRAATTSSRSSNTASKQTYQCAPPAILQSHLLSCAVQGP
mmetsp:Transcript_44113/g.116714  ORF Transcript_44113/g.116714 Transcript_44113/m.116714 type:complete len:85 (-) Transcript_44113:1939-2193(-)